MPFLRSLSIDSYHEDPALSATKIKVYLQQGAWMFHQVYVAKVIEPEDKPCFSFGRAFDDMLAEPMLWHAKYSVKPAGCHLGKPVWKAWAAEQNGRELINLDDHLVMLAMQQGIRRNQLATEMLAGAEAQLSIRRNLPEYRIHLQGRPDWAVVESVPGTGRIIDIKTCESFDAFERQVIPFGYHIQMAIAQWLLAQEGYQCAGYLLACEKNLAGRARVYRIPEEALAAGWVILKKAIREISERMESGDWSEPQTEPVDLALPYWQKRKLEEAANASYVDGDHG